MGLDTSLVLVPESVTNIMPAKTGVKRENLKKFCFKMNLLQKPRLRIETGMSMSWEEGEVRRQVKEKKESKGA